MLRHPSLQMLRRALLVGCLISQPLLAQATKWSLNGAEAHSLQRENMRSRGLNLTDEQRLQIEAIKQKYEPAFRQLSSNRSSPTSMSIFERARHHVEFTRLRTAKEAEVLRILTSDQRAVYDANTRAFVDWKTSRHQAHAATAPISGATYR